MINPYKKNVTVYSKPYHRKTKSGKKVEGTTEEKLIRLSKEDPFIHEEEVIVLKVEDYTELNNPNKIIKQKDEQVAELKSEKENIATKLDNVLNENENLKQQLKDKDEQIRNLIPNPESEKDKDEEIAKLNEDLKNEKDISKNAISKQGIAESKLAKMEQKEDNIATLFRMILKSSDVAIAKAITETKNETYNKNKESVSNLSLWKRIKGINLEDPEISEEDIKAKCYEIINVQAEEVKKLEDKS
jgi:hypothetical protein